MFLSRVANGMKYRPTLSKETSIKSSTLVWIPDHYDIIGDPNLEIKMGHLIGPIFLDFVWINWIEIK